VVFLSLFLSLSLSLSFSLSVSLSLPLFSSHPSVSPQISPRSFLYVRISSFLLLSIATSTRPRYFIVAPKVSKDKKKKYQRKDLRDRGIKLGEVRQTATIIPVRAIRALRSRSSFAPGIIENPFSPRLLCPSAHSREDSFHGRFRPPPTREVFPHVDLGICIYVCVCMCVYMDGAIV